MNYRLFTSLLLVAVLTALYLWWSQPEGDAPTEPPPAPESIGQLKIF
jgi:hypothetical protein